MPVSAWKKRSVQEKRSKSTGRGQFLFGNVYFEIYNERAHIRNLAQVTRRLEEYEGWVEKAAYEELLQEKHISSRLGENMRAASRPRPTDRHDPHAVVSGSHPRAADSRIKLAECRVGIDEHPNGVWLPRSGKDAKRSNNWATPKAVPHSRTHRKTYYEWVEERLDALNNGEDVRRELLYIGRRLEHTARCFQKFSKR